MSTQQGKLREAGAAIPAQHRGPLAWSHDGEQDEQDEEGQPNGPCLPPAGWRAALHLPHS